MTGETLETVENCIAGVESAVGKGAAVTKLGIWNYYYFCGDDEEYQPAVNPYYNPAADQAAWLAWVQKTASAVLEPAALDYTESLDGLKNPERGFYSPCELSLKLTGSTAKNPSVNLVHLRVGLNCLSPTKNDGAEPLMTADMLAALSQTLESIRTRGSTTIVRFAYDNFWGYGDREPSMETICAHIAQLKPVFYEYADVIASVEAGFIGPWGEMHTSKMATAANFTTLTDALLDAVPASVCITLRRPKFYADWKAIALTAIDTDVTAVGTDAYRVGIYNDGYLG